MTTLILVVGILIVLGALYLMLGEGLKKGESAWLQEQPIRIFSGSEAEAQSAFRGKDAQYFSPTSSDIQAAEELFRKEVPNLDSYYRQYYGTQSIVDKKRVINMRAVEKRLADSEYPKWRGEILFVLDGGNAFLDGTANLDTGLVLVQPHGES